MILDIKKKYIYNKRPKKKKKIVNVYKNKLEEEQTL